MPQEETFIEKHAFPFSLKIISVLVTLLLSFSIYYLRNINENLAKFSTLLNEQQVINANVNKDLLQIYKTLDEQKEETKSLKATVNKIFARKEDEIKLLTRE